MKKEYRDKLPKWVDEVDSNKNILILTDDIDSLFSCAILNDYFWGLNVEGFYNFKELYFTEPKKIKGMQPIWIDSDCSTGKVFGNHVTYVKNDNAINMNQFKSGGYTNKYAGSTVLTILSVYDYDLTQFSDEQLMVLLAIDSSFLGAYSDYFYNTWEKWMNIMELDVFINLVDKYTIDDFNNIIKKYSLKEKIRIKNGKLKTDIKLKGIRKLFPLFDFDMNLGEKQFNKFMEFETFYGKMGFIKHDENKIFSSARTYKNQMSYSVKKKGVKNLWQKQKQVYSTT
jgi:hypothetical protein